MNYKGKLADLGPSIVKTALGQQTNADTAEFIRLAFINGMRQGEKLCFDCGTGTPDWRAYTVDGTFFPDHFFNFEFFSEEANYMPYVRENENHGIGGVNPGHGYIRSANFSCTIRSGVESEAELNEVISKIPMFNE